MNPLIEVQINTTDKGLAYICELFWKVNSNLLFVHKVEELAQFTKIDKVRLLTIIREACTACVPDWKCSGCDKPFTFSIRSDFLKSRSLLLSGSYRKISFLCHECETKRREKELVEKTRQEDAARKVREAAGNELRKKIREMYDLAQHHPVNVQELSLKDMIYMVSILRGGAQENLTKIIPISMFEQPLSADDDFSNEIIKHLYLNGLLHVHPDSDPDGFNKDDISTFYLFDVYYAPPESQTSPDDPKVLISELLNLINGAWSENWCQQALEIWKKVALSECKEFLLYVLQEHHFDFSPGEKTTQNLEYALEHFSTAQVFNIIWRAGKDAAAYYQRGGIPPRQAANSAVAGIQRITERAIADNWVIKPYGRNFNCPQSVISEVLYDLALRLGGDGFQSVSKIEVIRAKRLVSENLQDG